MRQFKADFDLLISTVEIATEAGLAIMGVYQQMHNAADQEGSAVLVTQKADGSLLTQADLLAHQIISERLIALTPDIRVVSEEDSESIDRNLSLTEFWLVDPLDGTKEFLAKNGEFTVNIALIRNGLPVFGVVVAPALDLFYWGGPDFGAFRKRGEKTQPIRVARYDGGDKPMLVVASKSHLNMETTKFIANLGRHELVSVGSSLKFCLIAEGAAHIYPRLGPTCEWDTAAAHAILEGAGGYVLTLDGSSLRYGKKNILNSYFVASSVPQSALQESC